MQEIFSFSSSSSSSASSHCLLLLLLLLCFRLFLRPPYRGRRRDAVQHRQVHLQTVPRLEGPLAALHRTGVRPLLTVDQLVARQVAALAEGLPAEGALVGAGAGVAQLVLLQVVPPFEEGRAEGALVHLDAVPEHRRPRRLVALVVGALHGRKGGRLGQPLDWADATVGAFSDHAQLVLEDVLADDAALHVAAEDGGKGEVLAAVLAGKALFVLLPSVLPRVAH